MLGSTIALAPGLVIQLIDPAESGAFRLPLLSGGFSVSWQHINIVAVAFTLAVLALVGSRVTGPVRKVYHAANAMSAGDFRKRVSLRTGDELESLGHSFNTLGESLMRHELDIKAQADLMAALVESSRQLSSSLDLRQCGKTVARSLCEQLGASSAVVYRSGDSYGSLQVIGKRGSGGTAGWKRLAIHASDSGEYLVVSEQRAAEDGGEAFLAGVPMRVGSRSVGAVVARFDGGVSRSDLRLGSIRADVLTAFGIHAASAIVNAEVHSQTERYSEILEDWVEHLSGVMKVTNAISPSLNLEQTMSALARATSEVLRGDECAIFLLDRQGDLVARSCCGPRESRFGLKVEIGQPVTGAAFAEKRPVSCFDAAVCGEPSSPDYAADAGFRGVLSAPLIVADEAIGAITVYNKKPRHFKPDEMRMLTSIALHAAVVVRNADIYTREASIAETLQKGLVSRAPENVAGITFSSRYLPALDEARIGGDFYDVTELRDGRVAVVIGDVSGKGLQAAIHLATCKYMLKALIYTYPDDPALVLCELNDALNHYFDLSFFVTVFIGVIDLRAGTLTYASAGHPPAVLISENGRLHSDLSSTGIPVGAGQVCEYESVQLDICREDTLLLYTDGVTEAVRGDKLLGVEGLHEMVFRAGARTPEELVDRVCRQLVEQCGPRQRDDIALLAASFGGMQAQAEQQAPVGGTNERERITTKTA